MPFLTTKQCYMPNIKSTLEKFEKISNNNDYHQSIIPVRFPENLRY